MTAVKGYLEAPRRPARSPTGQQAPTAHGGLLWLLALMGAAFLCLSAPAVAQSSTQPSRSSPLPSPESETAESQAATSQAAKQPSVSYRALPALIRVGVPRLVDRHAVDLAGSIGSGWIERQPGSRISAHRSTGSLAISYSPLPLFSFALDLSGRMDAFPGQDETPNLYGEPRLTARYVALSRGVLQLGIEADVRFVGAQAPDIQGGATSPSLRALLATDVLQRTLLALSLGLHLDGSENAIPTDAMLSPADRLTLGASCCNALQWGFGASHRFRTLRTEWLAEISGELLVGNRAPQAGASPWQMSFGARHPLADAWSLMATAHLGLSTRPELEEISELVPIHPRLSGRLTVSWRPNLKPAPAPPPPAPPPEIPELTQPQAPKPKPDTEPSPEVPPPPAASSVTGTVVDEAGAPIPDAKVTLHIEGQEPVSARTFADGSFDFSDIPNEAPVRIEVRTPGYDTAEVELEPGKKRTHEVVLYPALPAGLVRGSVLDLQGQPIEAQITVLPEEELVQVSPDGSFELELSPGKHTLRFEQPGYSSQKRVIHVEERGVVILNIALSPQ